ncbi:MAG: response regulator [Desulfobacteraceae bacterium]
MTESSLLKYKRVLIVDDEPDVLDSLEELLPMCDVVRAESFEEARDILEVQYFDIAILDIMGVDGYSLLEIAKRKNVIPVMLTAHAPSREDLKKSYVEGAASYVPKDELRNITTYLNDVLEAKEKGKNFWWRWFDRLEAYFDDRFGPGWQSKDKEFWEKMKSFNA